MCMCGAPTGNTKSKGSVEKDSKKTKEHTKKGVYLSPCVIYFALIFHTVWRKLGLLKMHSHFEILPLSKIKGEQPVFSFLALCYSKEKICVQHFPHFPLLLVQTKEDRHSAPNARLPASIHSVKVLGKSSSRARRGEARNKKHWASVVPSGECQSVPWTINEITILCARLWKTAWRLACLQLRRCTFSMH